MTTPYQQSRAVAIKALFALQTSWPYAHQTFCARQVRDVMKGIQTALESKHQELSDVIRQSANALLSVQPLVNGGTIDPYKDEVISAIEAADDFLSTGSVPRLYHLASINDQTGAATILTSYPDTREHCMTILSKQSAAPKKIRRMVLEVSPGHPQVQGARVVDGEWTKVSSLRLDSDSMVARVSELGRVGDPGHRLFMADIDGHNKWKILEVDGQVAGDVLAVEVAGRVNQLRQRIEAGDRTVFTEAAPFQIDMRGPSQVDADVEDEDVAAPMPSGG